MKKTRDFILSGDKLVMLCAFVIMLMSLSACSSRENTEEKRIYEDNQTKSQILSDEKNSKDNSAKTGILIAYFSWAENAVQEDVDAMTSASVIMPGNVTQLATWIAEETGGDLFSIRVVKPYPADWDECLNRANEEKAKEVLPELLQSVENIDDYDVIFLGYPNWWYSCPMAIFSFLKENNLSGKQVFLFCSHGTGGLARSVQDISSALTDSNISENVFDAYEEDTANSQNKIREWLKAIDY